MKEKVFFNGAHRYELVDADSILEPIRGGYLDYKKKFDEASVMHEQDMPMYIVLELNNYCNMRCKMCIKSIDKNANGKDNMSMQMLEKIIFDANEIGVPSFIIGGETECTINPRIKDMIRLCRKKGNQIDNVLITNGYELTKEISELLIDLQWEKLFVSVDAANSETYMKIRGKDLSVVERNLNQIIRMKEEKNSQLPIIRVSFCIMPENKDEKEAFFDKWKDKVQFIDYQNLVHFEDMSIKKDLPETEEKCGAPFSRLMIDCYGNIFPCCTEWSKYLPLGNVANMSIKEAWNCETIVKLRHQISDGNLCDVCKNCLYSTDKN